MTKKSCLYTFTGDTGQTSLVGGQRVDKDCCRIESYGTIDELNSHIGLLAAMLADEHPQKQVLKFIQNKLFNVGSYLATDNGGCETKCFGLGPEDVAVIEKEIDAMDAAVPALHAFLLPGGHITSAQAHVCRTVCRRAERNIISLQKETFVDADLLKFINRLSDYLFILARFNNYLNKTAEIIWDKDCVCNIH